LQPLSCCRHAPARIHTWGTQLGRQEHTKAELIRSLYEEEGRTLTREVPYQEFHRARFDYAFELCRELVPSRDAAVLDVGRSELSIRLSRYYRDFHTLGFPIRRASHGAEEDLPDPSRHIVFDLNDAQSPEHWVQLPELDLIMFAEVIEHLYTAPELALAFLSQGLRPGGLLICQTPNAVSLDKRVRMLLGANPFHPILLDKNNPAHFREYTRRELARIGDAIGLRLLRHEYREYFQVRGGPPRQLAGKAFKLLCRAVPQFRRGQTIVWQKP